jgi:hypothetical protein
MIGNFKPNFKKRDVVAHTGKLASLNRSWQRKEGTFRASGMAAPPSLSLTGHLSRLRQEELKHI